MFWKARCRERSIPPEALSGGSRSQLGECVVMIAQPHVVPVREPVAPALARQRAHDGQRMRVAHRQHAQHRYVERQPDHPDDREHGRGLESIVGRDDPFGVPVSAKAVPRLASGRSLTINLLPKFAS